MHPATAQAALPEETPAAQRILDAARPLFAARGFDGVSMQQVAVAAGVSKANVFHHFASKATLYRAVLRRSADEFRSLLGLLGDPQHGGLGPFARAHMRHLHANLESVGMFLRLLGESELTVQRQQAEELAAEALDSLIESLPQGQRGGHDSGALAIALLGANLLHLQLRHVLPRTRLGATLRDPERFATEVARMLDPTAHQTTPEAADPC